MAALVAAIHAFACGVRIARHAGNADPAPLHSHFANFRM
jgi:hypothetical protein